MLSLDQRIAGVLVPIFALRGRVDLGIGDTAALAEFVDWTSAQGFRLVKILPVNETGGDHSPYNAISARALEPTTIHTAPGVLPDLQEKDFEEELSRVDRAALESDRVDYSVVKPLKRRLLERAFARFQKRHLQKKTARAREFARFSKAEAEWLRDYALFRLLMEENGTECWDQWPQLQRSRAGARKWLAGLRIRERLLAQRRLRFITYVQWVAFAQWQRVHAYASERGVALMGDIPFGVSYYSADVWAQPQLFKQGWYGGTPPDRIFKHDPFVSKWGQNWGIPLYDWDAMRADGFRWWRRRVRGLREFFDLFRIDHVLGFYRIYGFPWHPARNGEFLPLSQDEAAARTGGERPHFHPRPDDTPLHKAGNQDEGEEYLRAILEEAGAGTVIGEDLGEVPDYVRPSLTELGIAGYKIPAWEKREDGSLIPGSDYQRLSIATYGTHDHDTLRAWWDESAHEAARKDGAEARDARRVLSQFAGQGGNPPREFTPELHEALLRALFESNSWIVVVMITDLFARAERFNLPGVGHGNWTQRLHRPISELEQEPVLPRVRSLLSQSGRAAQAEIGR